MLSLRIRWLLQAAAAAAILAFLLRQADLEGVGQRLRRVPPEAFALGFAAAAAGLLQQALRWKILLGNPVVPFRECYVYLGLGSALTMVAPSGAVADGAVGYWLGRRRGGVLRSLSALAAARLMGAAAGLLLVLAALPSHAWALRELRADWSLRKLLIVSLAAAALAAALLSSRTLRRRLPAIRKALPSPRPGALAAAAGLSLGVHLCQVGVVWIGYRAVGAPVAIHDVIFFTPLIIFLGMAPVSIGGMGVREGLGILFYTLLPGVGREQVLAQAGYGYLVLLGLAALNLALAAATLGPARRKVPAGGSGG